MSTSRQGSCAQGLGCSVVLLLAQAAPSYQHPGAFRGGPCVSQGLPQGSGLPGITESFLL